MGFGVAAVVGVGAGGEAEGGAAVAAADDDGTGVPAGDPEFPGPLEHAAANTIASARQLARRWIIWRAVPIIRGFSPPNAPAVAHSLPSADFPAGP